MGEAKPKLPCDGGCGQWRRRRRLRMPFSGFSTNDALPAEAGESTSRFADPESNLDEVRERPNRWPTVARPRSGASSFAWLQRCVINFRGTWQCWRKGAALQTMQEVRVHAHIDVVPMSTGPAERVERILQWAERRNRGRRGGTLC